MRKRSNNTTTCSKCHLYKAPKDFTESRGKICNVCFTTHKKIRDLPIGTEVFYVSPVSGHSEPMIITEQGSKRGKFYYVRIAPIGKDVQGTLVLINHLRAI